ncbi:MAG: hypothetical protein K2H36_06190 [Clostridia bacterium]|nr:hypothetical protein [Clostridia bacterium]
MKKFFTCIIVVVMLLSIVCCVACTKETSFEKVVKCAKDMYDWATTDIKDFESFEIIDACGYKRGYDDYPFTVFIYIPFRITYTDGEYWEDVAYYVGDSFIGYYSDFDDGTYEKKLDLEEQLLYLNCGLIFLGDEADEKFSKEEITQAISPTEPSEEAGAVA